MFAGKWRPFLLCFRRHALKLHWRRQKRNKFVDIDSVELIYTTVSMEVRTLQAFDARVTPSHMHKNHLSSIYYPKFHLHPPPKKKKKFLNIISSNWRKVLFFYFWVYFILTSENFFIFQGTFTEFILLYFIPGIVEILPVIYLLIYLLIHLCNIVIPKHFCLRAKQEEIF